MPMSETRLRHIIRQALLAESDADKGSLANVSAGDEPLGKYAFSPQRQWPRPPEPNTPLEQDLYWSLYLHFVDPESNKSFTKNRLYSEIVSDILKKGQYPDVFKAPDVDVVYRGIRLSIDTLRKMLPSKLISEIESLEAKDKNEVYEIDDLSEIANRYEVDAVITNRENRPVSSWTRSIYIATEFSNRIDTVRPGGEYSVILCALVDDPYNRHKFLDADPLYGIGGIGSSYEDEQEVISIGSISLESMYIVRVK